MKNIFKIRVFTYIFAPLVIFVVCTACTSSDNREGCEKKGGIWYRDTCITSDTPEEKLRKVGLLESEKSDKYEINVHYPVEVLKYPKIHSRLKDMVARMKTETGIYSAGETNNTATFPWTLDIEMDEYRSAGGIASILIYAMSYTGGAHPNHYYDSVTFSTETQKMLNLEDLFDDPDYIYRISEYVTSELIKQKSEKTGRKIETDEWIETGSLPLPSNFGIFVIKPSDNGDYIKGLEFIFPPYAVGPYAEGKYEVFVPSGLFVQYVADEYREMFITEKKEAK